MHTEIDRDGEIAELKADIRAIKVANPNWASDANIRADIRVINQRLALLEQPGKFPLNRNSHHIRVQF